jgi:hypothetical protein
VALFVNSMAHLMFTFRRVIARTGSGALFIQKVNEAIRVGRLIKGKVSEDLKRRIIKTLVYRAHLMWVISMLHSVAVSCSIPLDQSPDPEFMQSTPYNMSKMLLRN